MAAVARAFAAAESRSSVVCDPRPASIRTGGPPLSVSLLLSLREGVTAERSGSAGVVFEGHGVRLSIRPDDPCLVEALLGLAPPGWDEDHLADQILSAGSAESLAAWYYAVQRLARRG